MSVLKALGHAANQRGDSNEQRVVAVLQDNAPHWLLSARAATEEEDAKGIDVVVMTDVGKLFLQVKSSKTGVAKHNSKRRRSMIGVVRCNHQVSDARLRERVHGILKKLRMEIQNRRSPG